MSQVKPLMKAHLLVVAGALAFAMMPLDLSHASPARPWLEPMTVDGTPPEAGSSHEGAERSVMPGVPRAVRVDLVDGEIVVGWQPPSSNGSTPLAGYVVIPAGETPFVVPAETTMVRLPAGVAGRFALAATNDLGTSLRTEFVGLAE